MEASRGLPVPSTLFILKFPVFTAFLFPSAGCGRGACAFTAVLGHSTSTGEQPGPAFPRPTLPPAPFIIA